jgi:hypothetical protein
MTSSTTASAFTTVASSGTTLLSRSDNKRVSKQASYLPIPIEKSKKEEISRIPVSNSNSNQDSGAWRSSLHVADVLVPKLPITERDTKVRIPIPDEALSSAEECTEPFRFKYTLDHRDDSQSKNISVANLMSGDNRGLPLEEIAGPECDEIITQQMSMRDSYDDNFIQDRISSTAPSGTESDYQPSPLGEKRIRKEGRKRKRPLSPTSNDVVLHENWSMRVHAESEIVGKSNVRRQNLFEQESQQVAKVSKLRRIAENSPIPSSEDDDPGVISMSVLQILTVN